jgi:hypothetical protein
VQRNQRAERADHLDQARRQADFFFGFAQGREHQVRVFRVAAPAGKGHFAAVGGQALARRVKTSSGASLRVMGKSTAASGNACRFQ